MTLKIERIVSSEDTVLLRLCGRIEVGHLSTIAGVIGRERRRVILDLEEVTLVDRETVNLLARCELKGITLTNCPIFLREWVTQEQRCMGTGF